MPTGLEDWFWNFVQINTFAVTPQSVANIPRPYVEFAIFGAFKGGEIASVIGGLFIHPIYRYYLKRRLTPETITNNSFKVIRNTCRRIQGRCLIGGLLAGPLVALTYAASCTERELKEWCYKIRCHEKNMVTDRTAFCLGFLGWYWKRFQGAADGINIGLTYSVFYFTVLKKYTSPMLVDRVKPRERLPDTAESENRKSTFNYFWRKKQDESQGARKS